MQLQRSRAMPRNLNGPNIISLSVSMCAISFNQPKHPQRKGNDLCCICVSTSSECEAPPKGELPERDTANVRKQIPIGLWAQYLVFRLIRTSWLCERECECECACLM